MTRVKNKNPVMRSRIGGAGAGRRRKISLAEDESKYINFGIFKPR
jgi:hypothetical protein